MFVYFDLEINCQRFPFSLPLILASQDHLQNSPRSPGRALRHFFCSAASDPSVLLTWGAMPQELVQSYTVQNGEMPFFFFSYCACDPRVNCVQDAWSSCRIVASLRTFLKNSLIQLKCKYIAFPESFRVEMQIGIPFRGIRANSIAIFRLFGYSPTKIVSSKGPQDKGKLCDLVDGESEQEVVLAFEF